MRLILKMELLMRLSSLRRLLVCSREESYIRDLEMFHPSTSKLTIQFSRGTIQRSKALERDRLDWIRHSHSLSFDRSTQPELNSRWMLMTFSKLWFPTLLKKSFKCRRNSSLRPTEKDWLHQNRFQEADLLRKTLIQRRKSLRLNAVQLLIFPLQLS